MNLLIAFVPFIYFKIHFQTKYVQLYSIKYANIKIKFTYVFWIFIYVYIKKIYLHKKLSIFRFLMAYFKSIRALFNSGSQMVRMKKNSCQLDSRIIQTKGNTKKR